MMIDKNAINVAATQQATVDFNKVEEKKAEAKPMAVANQATAKEQAPQVAPAPTATAQVADKPKPKEIVLVKQKDVANLLERYKEQISNLLPSVLDANRMLAMASTTIAKNPKLLECTPTSLIGAVMQAAMLGFPPIDKLDYCYFSPYWNSKISKFECEFLLGYKGAKKLAYNGGAMDIEAHVVREGDYFDFQYGSNSYLHFKPQSSIYAKRLYAYASAIVPKVIDGKLIEKFQFLVMPIERVEELRKLSPNQLVYNKESNRKTPSDQPVGIWALHYDAMAKAKVTKEFAKMLDLSPEAQMQLATDSTKLNVASVKTGKEAIEDIDFENIDAETGEILVEDANA